MKLMMTLLVRDEEDILRENLEFHLAHGVDEVILTDNLSVDGTAEIAWEYQRAGVLHYRHEACDDYAQGRWVTEMARQARRDHGADWVINCDADELWFADIGTVKEALAAVSPHAQAALVERTNFAARPENGEPFWRRMVVRYAVSLNVFGTPLIPKVAHRGLEHVVVDQGSHRAWVGGQPLVAAEVPITILHFPIRSPTQIANKIIKGGAAYARNTDLPWQIGATWRHYYDQYLRGELDQVWERACLSAGQVASGIASGELMLDERLLYALAEVQTGHSHPLLEGVQ